MRIILGSKSPRRAEILSFFSLPFEIQTPDFDEEAHPFEDNPGKYASHLAQGKARSLAARFPEAVILSADTVVFKEGKVYAKPSTFEEHKAMLVALNGHWHSVFTAVTSQKGLESTTRVEETRVLFHALNSQEIEAYCRHVPAFDKAGGYAIQGKGALLVKKIEGCYYNVMGLPINALLHVLKHFDIDLWRHLE
jgi:septum formation protein